MSSAIKLPDIQIIRELTGREVHGKVATAMPMYRAVMIDPAGGENPYKLIVANDAIGYFLAEEVKDYSGAAGINAQLADDTWRTGREFRAPAGLNEVVTAKAAAAIEVEGSTYLHASMLGGAIAAGQALRWVNGLLATHSGTGPVVGYVDVVITTQNAANAQRFRVTFNY